VTGESAWANAKVFIMDRMLAAANTICLVMSDSDIRVTRGLDAHVRLSSGFEVGVATCPYRAVAGARLLVVPGSHRMNY